MVDVASLPAHLRTEVNLWLSWLGDREATRATPYDAACFARDVLTTKTLTVRLSCWNALNEWYAKHLKIISPFAKNPLPYNLLHRYVERDFSEVWRAVAALPDPVRGRCALVALTRCKVDSAVSFQADQVASNLVAIEGRLIPVTDQVVGWLRCLTPGDVGRAEVLAGLPGSVADVHAALNAELVERGVPETTRATIYGRWSAMGVEVARCRYGLFRVPLIWP